MQTVPVSFRWKHRVMERLANQTLNKFSPDLREYFKARTNPFSDDPIKFTGSPGKDESSAAYFTISEQLSFSAADFGVPETEGAKMDAHIVFLPIANTTAFMACNLPYPGVMRNGAGDYDKQINFGPVTVQAVATGLPTYQQSTGSTPHNVTTLTLPSGSNSSLFYSEDEANAFGSRILELVAVGVEFIDKTAKYYQQGSLTCYPILGTQEQSTFYKNPLQTPTGNTNGFITVQHTNGPANNLGEAVRVPGSRTWDCDRGAYLIPRRRGENETVVLDNMPILLMGKPDTTEPGTSVGNFSFVSLDAGLGGALINSEVTNPSALVPYNAYGIYISGVNATYFSGLVKLVQYWKITSPVHDRGLVPLMKPTLPYNAEMEKYIDTVLSSSSYCYPYDENPSGEAWRKILKIAGNVSRNIGKAANVFVPGAAEVGDSAGKLFDATAETIPIKKKKGKKSQPAAKAKQPGKKSN